jgi:hypothetical protein
MSLNCHHRICLFKVHMHCTQLHVSRLFCHYPKIVWFMYLEKKYQILVFSTAMYVSHGIQSNQRSITYPDNQYMKIATNSNKQHRMCPNQITVMCDI